MMVNEQATVEACENVCLRHDTSGDDCGIVMKRNFSCVAGSNIDYVFAIFCYPRILVVV